MCSHMPCQHRRGYYRFCNTDITAHSAQALGGAENAGVENVGAITFIHFCTYMFLCNQNNFRSMSSLCWTVSNNYCDTGKYCETVKYSRIFHSWIFHPCIFARIAFSTPAFSVAPMH